MSNVIWVLVGVGLFADLWLGFVGCDDFVGFAVFFFVDFTLCGQALFVLWCRRMMCCVPYKILLLFCIAQLRQQCIIVGILCVVE